MNMILLIDVGSTILVIITLILWIAILFEKFVHPAYKNLFRGTPLWPSDDLERRRLKKCMQGVGLYYFTAALLLLFTPAIAILMGFGGIFYAIIIYYWLVVSKREKRS
ncbi:MAG: hypothetical protein JSV73_02225 [Flavobacteriaceae bacterium]|nr:MAG: hypothetical protein JSV73_02225 [Flavobacteriaceae bacterium]